MMDSLHVPLVSGPAGRAVAFSRPAGSLRVGEAVAYFAAWLTELGKKSGNYPRIARAYMNFCLAASYGFDVTSLGLFAATKGGSQASAVRKFLVWHHHAGQPVVVPDLPSRPRLPAALNALILQFIDAHHSLHSQESRATYTRVLNGFFLFLDGETEAGRPDHLSERSVRNYLQTLVDKQLSAFTRRLYLTVLQQLVAWVLQQRDVRGLSLQQVEDLSRISLIQGPSIDTTTFYKDPLSGEERAALMDSLVDVRDRAMVALMAWGGLRTVELVRLRLSDVELGASRLFVQGKGKETRRLVAMDAECRDAVAAYLAADQYWPTATNASLQQHRPLFERMTVTRSIRRKVRQFLQELGLASNRRSAHSLRHTAAQELLNGGVDSGFVQRHLRHANFQSTLGYTINHYDQEYMAKITVPRPKKRAVGQPDLPA